MTAAVHEVAKRDAHIKEVEERREECKELASAMEKDYRDLRSNITEGKSVN